MCILVSTFTICFFSSFSRCMRTRLDFFWSFKVLTLGRWKTLCVWCFEEVLLFSFFFFVLKFVHYIVSHPDILDWQSDNFIRYLIKFHYVIPSWIILVTIFQMSGGYERSLLILDCTLLKHFGVFESLVTRNE